MLHSHAYLHALMCYVQNTGGGAEGSGQFLESPGSCLQQFSTLPFVECNNKGVCHFYNSDLSFWLANVDGLPMERLKGNMALPRISRCRVCKTPPGEIGG